MHWDGFFDRESGVLFYQYGFYRKPIDTGHFHLSQGTNLVLKKALRINKKYILGKGFNKYHLFTSS